MAQTLLHTPAIPSLWDEVLQLFLSILELKGTREGRSKGKAGATVTVAANMTTTMKKEFIFMLSMDLEKNNCKNYREIPIFSLLRKLFNPVPLC